MPLPDGAGRRGSKDYVTKMIERAGSKKSMRHAQGRAALAKQAQDMHHADRKPIAVTGNQLGSNRRGEYNEQPA